MKTLVLSQSPADIKIAIDILKKGGLVAFPTETVYGLGASINCDSAIKNIFKVKGRPQDNPLIVHICNKTQLLTYVKDVSNDAKVLMKKFWPGPLTLIFKNTPKVKKIVNPNNEVAIRMPASSLALALIKGVGPIVAPSANLAGKPSPTNALDVLADMDGKIDAVIKGEANVGLESTVLEVKKRPCILFRPGGVTLEELQKTLGDENITLFKKKDGEEVIAHSPGMKYTHYSPNAKVVLVNKPQNDFEEFVLKQKGKIGVICNKKIDFDGLQFNYSSKKVFAHNLFSWFRELDRCGVKTIYVKSVSKKGIGLALMNRLVKASSKEI
jgi:L-threonylcarbamoyladenylate synthase